MVEDVVVKKFTFAISSPDEFLVSIRRHILGDYSASVNVTAVAEAGTRLCMLLTLSGRIAVDFIRRRPDTLLTVHVRQLVGT